MKLKGFEIKNFRSIGESGVTICPWQTCNILIGQNNSGKSNAIKAISKIFQALATDSSHTSKNTKSHLLIDLDLHQRSQNKPFQFSLLFDITEDEPLVNIIQEKDFFFDFSWEVGQQYPTIIDYSATKILNLDISNKLLRFLNAGWVWNGRPPKEEFLKKMLREADRMFGHFKIALKPIYLIPEFRQIREGEVYSYDGSNLIKLLASWQHPEIGHDENRQKFDRIEGFVKQLLHFPNAQLEVTDKKDTIILKRNNLRLPLQSYGTGVHQLVIMLTAILSIENAVCCIEEPEIHLHPKLQREFVEFIISETSNQYLISTHSPTFINANVHMRSEIRDEIQVFHLRMVDDVTVGGPVLEDEHSLNALNDLGVKASDLIQANSVIWVEGPSDRIYINHWLGLLAPNLIEGLHYSIMFYGGNLRSHISLSRSKNTDNSAKVPDELINLLKVNQHAIVVIDSDKKQALGPINATKRRVRDECEASGGVSWVTEGRESENYIPGSVICSGFEVETGNQIILEIDRFDKFDQALLEATVKTKRKLDYSSDKVQYARMFIKYFRKVDLSEELQTKLEVIVKKIHDWNR